MDTIAANESAAIPHDDVARAARAMIAAHGTAAARLMRRRLVALRRRGDVETAALWHAVAEAVERRLERRDRA